MYDELILYFRLQNIQRKLDKSTFDKDEFKVSSSKIYEIL